MAKQKALIRPIEVKVKAYFLSDIHLESEQDSNFFVLNSLLQSILNDKECTHLFLLGDIFDLWVAHHSYFKAKFAHTLKKLHEIKDRGIEVHYFEGNHDLDLKPYFHTQGFKIHEEALVCEFGSKTFRIEHGDQMDPTDRGYLFLRWFLRTKLMRIVGRYLPGTLVERIGNSMSSTSRKYTDRLKLNLGQDQTDRREKIFEKIRKHVLKELKTGHQFDIFIAGHIHEELQEKLPFNGKEIEIINLGSWLGERKPYGVYDEIQGLQIRVWSR